MLSAISPATPIFRTAAESEEASILGDRRSIVPAAETLCMRQGPAFGDGSSASQKNLQFTPFGSTPPRTGASCQDAWHHAMQVGT